MKGKCHIFIEKCDRAEYNKNYWKNYPPTFIASISEVKTFSIFRMVEATGLKTMASRPFSLTSHAYQI
jgi:hypothetical protein